MRIRFFIILILILYSIILAREMSYENLIHILEKRENAVLNISADYTLKDRTTGEKRDYSLIQDSGLLKLKVEIKRRSKYWIPTMHRIYISDGEIIKFVDFLNKSARISKQQGRPLLPHFPPI